MHRAAGMGRFLALGLPRVPDPPPRDGFPPTCPLVAVAEHVEQVDGTPAIRLGKRRSTTPPTTPVPRRGLGSDHLDEGVSLAKNVMRVAAFWKLLDRGLDARELSRTTPGADRATPAAARATSPPRSSPSPPRTTRAWTSSRRSPRRRSAQAGSRSGPGCGTIAHTRQEPAGSATSCRTDCCPPRPGLVGPSGAPRRRPRTGRKDLFAAQDESGGHGCGFVSG